MFSLCLLSWEQGCCFSCFWGFPEGSAAPRWAVLGRLWPLGDSRVGLEQKGLQGQLDSWCCALPGGCGASPEHLSQASFQAQSLLVPTNRHESLGSSCSDFGFVLLLTSWAELCFYHKAVLRIQAGINTRITPKEWHLILVIGCSFTLQPLFCLWDSQRNQFVQHLEEKTKGWFYCCQQLMDGNFWSRQSQSLSGNAEGKSWDSRQQTQGYSSWTQEHFTMWVVRARCPRGWGISDLGQAEGSAEHPDLLSPALLHGWAPEVPSTLNYSVILWILLVSL